MTLASSPSVLSDGTTALCILFICLAPLASAGLAFINTGLGRSRSAAHLMMSSLCVMAIAAIVYCICGFSWQGFAGLPSHSLHIGGKPWSWLGKEYFLMRGLPLHGEPQSLAALLGMLSVGVAALIPLGSGGDRWRLSAACGSTAILAGITYPLFAHWVWGGGWLAQLGPNYGLGRGFVDAGGAGAIQLVGGLTALSIGWILGARRGKYAQDGMPAAIPGHNSVQVLFGCMLALTGWLGLNSAGAILFYGVGAGTTILVAINTILCAATSTVTAATITRVRFGKPDASLTANGWIGGLAASSAGCAFVQPAAAIAIGMVAGFLVTLSTEWIELHMSLDDPSGAISSHGVGGLWGLLAVAIFAQIPGVELNAAGASNQGDGQWLAQLAGIATLIGFILPLSYGLNWALNRFYRQRVAAEGEQQGMDLYELGAGAYPEFIMHSDDFTQRKI